LQATELHPTWSTLQVFETILTKLVRRSIKSSIRR
jgi:hypothetical protein